MIDTEHAIAHRKIIVIDGETIITGSFKCATSSVV
jgi:phosphatidylserine/phosphatidylglycerophosphate/cardiolipin synthase-like enzyme